MPILIVVLLIILTFFLLFVIINFFRLTFDLFLDLPYVATDRKKIATIIKLAKIKKAKGPEGTRRRETVIDLGSGDGRLLIAAAQKGAYAIGYEINPFLIALTRFRAYLRGYSSAGNFLRGPTSKKNQSPRRSDLNTSSVIVYKQNLWRADLAVADVIFVYAFKKSMKKFEDFIFSNAKKGTRIVANTNPFPTKNPQKSANGIFFYQV